MSMPLYFAQALKALTEIQIEMGEEPAPGADLLTPLADALEKMGTLQPNNLLLGIATDGLPVLLNLDMPGHGPLLTVGDRGSGKTHFLQMTALAASRFHSSEEIQFVVLTDSPAEWARVELPAHVLGVYTSYDASGVEMLLNLAEWVRAGGTQRPIILLWDGLDAALHLTPHAQQAARLLLTRGPRAGVWPLVTCNSMRAARMPEWVAFFRTRIYGRILDPSLEEELTPLPGAGLNHLFAGAQFCLRTGSRWLRFWVPQG